MAIQQTGPSGTEVNTPTVLAGQVNRLHTLLVVSSWELHRLLSARSTRLTTLALILLLAGIMWLRKEVTVIAYFVPEEERVYVHGGSAWGMVYSMPLLVLVFGIIVPFLSADGVARDLKQRTHELLMSTAIPSWAYVWGRFLAVLVLDLLLATLLLATTLLIGVVFALAMGHPFPNIAATFFLWVVAVLPAILLISGLSFGIGTLFPRYSGLGKVLIVVAWFLVSYEGLLVRGDETSSVYWDPTSRAMIGALGEVYQRELFNGIDTVPVGSGGGGQQQVLVPATQFTQEEKVRELRLRILDVEQHMPDLWPWAGPHLVLAMIGLGGTAIAVARFRRFSDVL
ncbi:MAG TPA: hypothetical protein VLQ48_01165 [Chloroflexia bacterium]|nr:hypothetical protein [Chloroflexia bacterium]